jgi:molecular chaperone DnaK (HSP70)
VFTTVADNQDTIAVRIYQGEARQAEGNTLLGEFEFSGFEPGPRGQVKIEVAFSISTEGIVTVQARDPKTGAEASTTVSMSSGLSEDQIQEIIARGRTADVAAERAPAERGPRVLRANEVAPLEEGEDVLLDMPSLEADVTELLEKRDETPFFGKMDSDLTDPGLPDQAQAQTQAGETTLEIEHTSRSFEGGGHDELPLSDDDDDDKVMGDD